MHACSTNHLRTFRIWYPVCVLSTVLLTEVFDRTLAQCFHPGFVFLCSGLPFDIRKLWNSAATIPFTIYRRALGFKAQGSSAVRMEDQTYIPCPPPDKVPIVLVTYKFLWVITLSYRFALTMCATHAWRPSDLQDHCTSPCRTRLESGGCKTFRDARNVWCFDYFWLIAIIKLLVYIRTGFTLCSVYKGVSYSM